MHGNPPPSLLSSDLCEHLRQETQKATGCTEIAASSLVVAKAVEVLGRPATSIELIVSPGVYKNGSHAGVPGMKKPGLKSAAALGAVLASAESGLNILDSVDAATTQAAEEFLNQNTISAIFTETDDALFFCAKATEGKDTAIAVISGAHSHFSKIILNETVILDAPYVRPTASTFSITETPVAILLKALNDIPISDLEFLYEAAEINAKASDVHLKGNTSKLGHALAIKSQKEKTHTSAAQAISGSASEARMTGSTSPIVAITGSGNHGITNFLGVYGLAQSLKVSRDETIRALAISSLITSVIKAHTGKITAFCGCSIAPATGLAAASVYLQGGNIETMEHAMQSVIGTFAGMLCDGAKTSCAYKVSTVVGGAVDLAELALSGAYVPDGDGILGDTIDETFANLALLNNTGMRQTELLVLKMINA